MDGKLPRGDIKGREDSCLTGLTGFLLAKTETSTVEDEDLGQILRTGG